MKRIISLTLVLLMALTCLSACTNNNAANFTPVPSNIDDGVFVYSITRSDTAPSAVETAAKELRTKIKKGLDCNIIILKDTTADYDDNYEILVGDTNREESATALDILKNNRANNAGDFIVKVIEDKIVITATTDTMIAYACEWFAETFGKSIEAWQMLRSDYEFIYAPDDVDSFVPTVNSDNLGYYKIVEPESYSYLCGKQVDTLVTEMANNGYSVTAVTDETEPSALEIIVGDTTREESKETTVEGDNYVIAVKNGKVIIKGGNDLATYQALTDFILMVKESFKNKTSLGLNDGYVKNGTYSAETEGTYTLNFDDEFNGSTVNYKVWGNYGSRSTNGSSCLGGKTIETGVTNTEYVNVSNGSLNLFTRKINDTDFQNSAVSTWQSMIYRYGYLESAVKFPEAPANCSLWTNMAYIAGVQRAFGDDVTRCAFMEIDVIENFGKTTTYASNVHRWWSAMNSVGTISGNGHNSMDGVANYNKEGNNKRVTYTKDDYLCDDFHIYSFYSDDKTMEFAFDGQVYCTFNYKDQSDNSSIFFMENFVIMTTSMGLSSYGAKWNATCPEEAHTCFDWIRIYQTNAVASQMRKCSGEGTPVTYVYPKNLRSE